jgi:hypothetical protein
VWLEPIDNPFGPKTVTHVSGMKCYRCLSGMDLTGVASPRGLADFPADRRVAVVGHRARRRLTRPTVCRSLAIRRATGTPPRIGLRVFSKCHDMRNRTDYEGALDVDDRLMADLIATYRKVADRVNGLPSIPLTANSGCGSG